MTREMIDAVNAMARARRKQRELAVLLLADWRRGAAVRDDVARDAAMERLMEILALSEVSLPSFVLEDDDVGAVNLTSRRA